MKRSKGSIWNSTLVTVIVVILIVVSFVLSMFVNPIEYFSNNPTLEYYYSETCPHCVRFSPIWDKAVAEMKKQGLKVSAVKYDMADKANQARAEQYGVQGMPTVLLVKESSIEFKDDRTVENLVSFVKQNL